MKPIRVTGYCEGRIAARKLDRELVEAVIRSPEQIVPDADDRKREIYQSRFRDMQLFDSERSNRSLPGSTRNCNFEE